MEDKRITEKESLAIISEMIQATKAKVTPSDFNLMVMWGWLCVAVTLGVYFMIMLTKKPIWNMLWFLIPGIGYPITMCVMRKEKRRRTVSTYISKSIGILWLTLGALFGVLVATGIVANIAGYDVWGMMYTITLPLIGVGCIATGTILRMRSFMAGGSFAVLAGAWIIGATFVTGSIPMYTMLLYATAFFAAFIIPGYSIRHKKDERA